MQFLNLTPFDTLCFDGLDLSDEAFRVVVMKVGYQILPTSIPGNFIVETSKEPASLCFRDDYYGAVNESSVREESDLAPYKPRCDVLLRGNTYAPHGKTTTHWDARIRVSSPQSSLQTASKIYQLYERLKLKPCVDARYAERWTIPVAVRDPSPGFIGSHRVLLDKTLQITGAREFYRHADGWRLSASQATTQVPLRWEHVFGGTSAVRNPRHAHDSNEPEFLLNEVCYSNPLGCGWIEERKFGALRKAGLAQLERTPAPQITYPKRSMSRPVVIRHPEQIDATNPDEFIRVAQDYGELPAGFGIVGRSWAPRLQMAGTYDGRWRSERWPLLPDDFDFGYWNCAPRDQQIEAFPPDARIELWNLATPDLTRDGYLCLDLPSDWPLIFLHCDDGLCLPLPMKTDTVMIDTDAMTLTLTHRFQFVNSVGVERLEVRLRRLPDTELQRA
ncbi:DUF2169 family type VI secretion system accessory protein [Caballeronia ptereochthonis]|uniref:DUF2169 domain-containing protein n=1 Tax=Caballeronia ptereochthonis TaxID=1777144 RepID=A0A158DP45_9BURK|nr:DUF2169 domain-containing protein [Caballeronia ptereochthonis]SAK96389.1 hypothetical protein AWB83_05718 [Caballeronia ptereochthonis]